MYCPSTKTEIPSRLTPRPTQNAASQLERTINRWAGEVLRLAPAPPATLQDAALADVAGAGDNTLFTEARPMMVQSLLRHAMSEAISEGIINCLIVTSSAEANIQITRIHEHLFARKCVSHPTPFTFCEFSHFCSLPLLFDMYSFPHSPSLIKKAKNKC